jgi:HD-GYP domain-containing protein (c-di-GMP phosphodiesterase class II)
MVVAGAVGYVVKGARSGQLAAAVRRAAERATHVDPQALEGLLEKVVEMARHERERRLQVERLAAARERTLDDTIRALGAALHSRDGYTGDHDDRVARMCEGVGRQLGISGRRLRDLRLGGILHDIGKIGVPDRILHKTGPLTDEEWVIIHQHTIYGEQILKPVDDLGYVAKIVRHSHEHWDGSGYPDALTGTDIPLESRIVLACDAFDAITTDRSYQKARDTAAALDAMEQLTYVHFDPDVVHALVQVVDGDGNVRQLGSEPAVTAD